MQFKLKHKDGGFDIELRTESDDPDQVQPLFVTVADTGNEWVTEEIKRSLLDELSKSRGIYGHLVDPLAVTNADLAQAIATLPSFEVIQNNVVTPQPLPEGALS